MDAAVQSRAARLVPWLAVGAAVVWNLVNLRAETLAVSYLDDSSVHEQMVRFAASRLQSGHLPLTSWFPYLGAGSPQFLHYQSLPAMLSGLLGTGLGGNAVFRWTLYLLLALWPAGVFLSARVFGLGRSSAAAAALISPFLMSVPGVGYEDKAYVWIGYGVWAQLWASLTLPLAWAFSWRAIREGRRFAPAVALVSLTAALHFETGYLAFLPLLLWPLVAGVPRLAAVRRAAVVFVGSLLASSWVIVPLLANRNWAATNEILRGTPLEDGYGARVIGWLVSGRLLDAHRIPVISVLALAGLVLVVTRWRTGVPGRAIAVAFAACLVLSLGRATFGDLIAIVPGSRDLFFRRFMMGAQLAALLLAGVGAGWALRAASGWLARARWHPRIRLALVPAVAVLVLAPAWLQLADYDRANARAIRAQRTSDQDPGRLLDRLLHTVTEQGAGRAYAGMPSNWGEQFTVGAVPVFKYLESRDVDEIGYTLRTASLMSDPEYYFQETNASDYSLFGVRYLILPAGRLPPVRARFVERAGRFSLFEVPDGGYVHAGTVVGTLAADRTNVGSRSVPLLRSRLASAGQYLEVAYGRRGGGRTPGVLPSVRPGRPAGAILVQRDDLVRGDLGAIVTMRRPGVVVLSASFDLGWRVTVDRRAQASRMIAPAIVGVDVPRGTHVVEFRYRGYAHYLVLFALSGLCLLALVVFDRRARAAL